MRSAQFASNAHMMLFFYSAHLMTKAVVHMYVEPTSFNQIVLSSLWSHAEAQEAVMIQVQ